MKKVKGHSIIIPHCIKRKWGRKYERTHSCSPYFINKMGEEKIKENNQGGSMTCPDSIFYNVFTTGTSTAILLSYSLVMMKRGFISKDS
jgi:hypothetical protein